ncbi:MAG: hypothetical protein EZS28_038641 [Streblomastix strix]|uniref:Uncharacterized protein n=1 Tax=Streblomastix strix TaxID=222440 RepID=A0A5J4U773_9EUKA|nr:MAG: hypothetical protein EZS28_038641 [Streblomastix strix]
MSLGPGQYFGAGRPLCYKFGIIFTKARLTCVVNQQHFKFIFVTVSIMNQYDKRPCATFEAIPARRKDEQFRDGVVAASTAATSSCFNMANVSKSQPSGEYISVQIYSFRGNQWWKCVAAKFCICTHKHQLWMSIWPVLIP